MATQRISKRTVDAFECPEGKDRVFLWDDKLKGFGLAAFKSKAKVYVVQYRTSGRTHRVKVGAHGRLTPESARGKAKAILERVEKGENPAEDKRIAREALTVAEAADLYLAYAKARRKPGTYAGYESALRLHIVPRLGAKRLHEIRRSDLQKIHTEMAEKKTQANRTIAVFSLFWSWAARGGHAAAASNPATGVELYGEEARERYLTGAEMASLGEAIQRAETVGIPYEVDENGANAKHAAKPENRLRRVDGFALAAIRLLMLTGGRLREILHAKWSYIDLERGMIFLPASKTGKKTIYLSAEAIRLLEGLPRIHRNPYVFPGERDGRPRADLKKPWDAICQAAGIEGVRLHDLRHSFASFGAGESLGLPIIGKLLGHTQAATTARYSHLDADPMKRAANLIGDKITRAMKGGAGDKKG